MSYRPLMLNLLLLAAKPSRLRRPVSDYSATAHCLFTPPLVPAIDWDAWRKSIGNSQLVDQIKSEYESIKFPSPENSPRLAELDAYWNKRVCSSAS